MGIVDDYNVKIKTMGLFSNSETTSKKNSIIRDIEMINKALNDISLLIDSKGMNNSTINSCISP